MKALLDDMSTAIPANLKSEFDSWAEGFDACTQFEQTGVTAFCPYVNKQAALWQQGYSASRRVTEIGREAA